MLVLKLTDLYQLLTRRFVSALVLNYQLITPALNTQFVTRNFQTFPNFQLIFTTRNSKLSAHDLGIHIDGPVAPN